MYRFGVSSGLKARGTSIRRIDNALFDRVVELLRATFRAGLLYRLTAAIAGEGLDVTSARIETKRSNFKAPAGGLLAIESRIQMPNVTGDEALGYWPAFWALGSPYRGNWWNWAYKIYLKPCQ